MEREKAKIKINRKRDSCIKKGWTCELIAEYKSFFGFNYKKKRGGWVSCMIDFDCKDNKQLNEV